MVTFTSVLVALTGATAILANPISREGPLHNLINQGPSTPNGQGTHDGFYYLMWSDGQGSVNYTNEVNSPYQLSRSPTETTNRPKANTRSHGPIPATSSRAKAGTPVQDATSHTAVPGTAQQETHTSLSTAGRKIPA